MDKPLKPYHLIWLAVHPTRTEAWLRAMLADGFHIHHLDGDHGNNAPGNLVLIEGMDHMMIHSGGRPMSRGFARKRKHHNPRVRESVPVADPAPEKAPATLSRAPVAIAVGGRKPGRRERWVKVPGRKL